MYKSDAYIFLTSIAQSEFVSSTTSKLIAKARDAFVCYPNRILSSDVQDEKSMEILKREYRNILEDIMSCRMFSIDVFNKAKELYDYTLYDDDGKCVGQFFDKCQEMVLSVKCQNCPNYAGYQPNTEMNNNGINREDV